MLRDTGCTLPVQIWHRGADEPVRPAELAGLGAVEIHDLTALRPTPRVLNGWEAKTVALLASGLERIFFLDADAYCLSDPAPLLDRLSAEEPFLFWEDYPSGLSHVTWSVWNLAGTSVPPIQGGQFAIHVRHSWRDLVLAHWIDQHSDFSYAHQYGDQDSWRVALTISGGPYTCLNPSRYDEIALICDLGDTPFVVHRCLAKMLYPEDVAPPFLGSANRRLDRLPGENMAWAHFETLLAARPAAETFGHIYAVGGWGPGECSGDGSTPENARPYLDLVNGLLKTGAVKRVIDLACGDGYIASRLEAPEVVGVDCHAPHVNRLRRESPEKQWLHLDLDRERHDLPTGDVALLKDVLHHWPNHLVREWLAWARTCGKWRWLICTQDRHQDIDGRDCALGELRPLNPAMEPLRPLGLVPLCDYLYKSVLLFEVGK
jgi:SAM-dependent methyltransferase